MRQILTLEDAKKNRLEIIAVCRNVNCRHRGTVDLDTLIHNFGLARGLLPVRGEVHFSDKMRCSRCGQRGVLFWPAEVKGPEPIFEAQKGLTVHTWQYNDYHNIVARVGHIMVAHAAFDAAVSAYPGRRVTLQEGMRVLRDDKLRVVEGGKK